MKNVWTAPALVAALIVFLALWSISDHGPHPPLSKPGPEDIIAFGSHGNKVSFEAAWSGDHDNKCDVVIMARNHDDPPLHFRMVDSMTKDGKWDGDNALWDGPYIGKQIKILPGVDEIDVWDFGKKGVRIDHDHLTPDVRLSVKAGETLTVPAADPAQAEACRGNSG